MCAQKQGECKDEIFHKTLSQMKVQISDFLTQHEPAGESMLVNVKIFNQKKTSLKANKTK